MWVMYLPQVSDPHRPLAMGMTLSELSLQVICLNIKMPYKVKISCSPNGKSTMSIIFFLLYRQQMRTGRHVFSMKLLKSSTRYILYTYLSLCFVCFLFLFMFLMSLCVLFFSWVVWSVFVLIGMSTARSSTEAPGRR